MHSFLFIALDYRQLRCSYNVNIKISFSLSLSRCGELSRAARSLTSGGLAPANADTVERLKSKHPRRYPESTFAEVNSAFDPLSILHDVIAKALQSSPRGSGAGNSGWRFEHLKCLLHGSTTRDILLSTLSQVATGRLPDFAAGALSSSRLIALPKQNGDVRPIAVGEAIRRIAAKAICMHMKNSFSSFFAPIQHGVST